MFKFNPFTGNLDQTAPSLATLDGRYLQISNNLSDLNNAATARTNLGLVAGGAGDIWVEKAGDDMTGALGVNLSANPAGLGEIWLGGSKNVKQIRLGNTTTPGFLFINESGGIFEWSSARDGTAGTFPNTGIASAAIQLISANLDSKIVFKTTTTNNANASTRMTLDKNGDLGIGIVSTGSRLHVQDDTSAQIALQSATSTDTGTTAFVFKNSAGTNVGAFGYGHTTRGTLLQDRMFITGAGAKSIAIAADVSGGVIIFATGGEATANERMRINASGATSLTPGAVSGGASALTITPAAHTDVTAEKIALSHEAQTLTITGGYATQRFVNIARPTVLAASALAITTASTVEIGGAPTGTDPATNAKLNNLRILRLAPSGITYWDRNSTTSSYFAVEITAHTLDLYSAQSITSAESIAGLRVGQISYSVVGNPQLTIVAGAIISTPTQTTISATGPRPSLVAGLVLGRENVNADFDGVTDRYFGAIMQAHTFTHAQDATTFTSTPGIAGINIEQITIANNHPVANTWNNVSGLHVVAPTAGVRSQTVNHSSGAFGGDLTLQNIATTNYHNIRSRAHTVTLATTTQMTATPGIAGLSLGALTVNQTGGAVTVDSAATAYIASAPVAGASVTLTNNYALWVDAGTSRFDGRILGNQGADVASANDLTLGADGNVFEITGTTQINAITTSGWQNGSVIRLIFTSTPTVKHNTAGGAGTAVMLLSGAADFSATADDVLTLVLSEVGGTQAWREVSRSAN